MKSFFQDVFEYHHHFNQVLAKKMLEHLPELTQRSIPLFSHCINAHQIWNSRILGKPSLGVHEVHTLEELMKLDDGNLQDTLKILNTRNLEEVLTYTNSRGDSFQNSIRDILFHTANHFTHHKGQLISDLRLQGIEPPVTDYIFYKR